jgi:hypothetical protein
MKNEANTQTYFETTCSLFHSTNGIARGYVMAQLIEALCHKPEGREFDFRLSHSHFSFT